MIMFYFSGTGNSKYIAELFCRHTGAGCRSIEEEADFTRLISPETTVCFCYPVYGSRVPRVMREFAERHMAALKGKELMIFCTQMVFSGDGARAFYGLFPRGSVTVRYAEHFLMPNNVCNLFFLPLAGEKSTERYLKNAGIKMEKICAEIQRGTIRKRGFNPVSRALGAVQGVFMPGLERRALNKVWIDGSCDGCGRCVTSCPMKNLKRGDGGITTDNNCTMCYRCINLCPKKAISVFVRGKIKRQYKGVTK